jgi:Transposase and inactivated derivatives
MSVVPDHIHLIMDVPPTMSVSEPFRLLNGCSSYELFKENPNSENKEISLEPR